MTADSLKRKLTAGMYCDVAGYSRLSGSDEEGTHRRVMQVLDFGSKQISRDGDLIVLEGSVRKAGNRVRANVQLIDALTGHHVWAERYDREMEDIFDLQDEMVSIRQN